MEGDVGVLGASGKIEALGGRDGVGDGGEDALVEEEGSAKGDGVGHGAASRIRPKSEVVGLILTSSLIRVNLIASVIAEVRDGNG